MMWGEFEDDVQQEEEKDGDTLQPDSSQALPSPQEAAPDYTHSLRDRLVHCLSANTAVVVKSQQNYEPELTYEERKEIVEKFLDDKPGQFLYRFGKHLEQEHFQYFLKYEGDAEVDHYLLEALKHRNKHTSRIMVRNRRYAALKKLCSSGDYFSEQEMERRDPLLYDHLIGQYQTTEERDSKFAVARSDIRFSSILLKHVDNCEEKTLKKQQQEEEDDMFEEEEEEEEEEEGEDPAAEATLDQRGKQLLKEEFYTSEYSKFIRGQDDNFDYGQVDTRDDDDLLDFRARDEEERYFDDDDDDCGQLMEVEQS